MAEKKEYVKLWLSYATYFEAYSAAEVGRLVLAMMQYKSSGVEPEFSGSERFIWPAIKRDIDEAAEYQTTLSEQNREKANMRWHPENADACNGMQSNAENAMDQGIRKEGKGQRTRTKDNPPQPPKGADPFVSFAGDNSELLSALRDFEAMRKKIRAPMTDRAKDLLCKELEKLSQSDADWVQILNQSIANSWKGVFPLKGETGTKPKGGAKNGAVDEHHPGGTWNGYVLHSVFDQPGAD